MEPILLYGHPKGSSLGLVAALEWLGQPYRLSRVDMLTDMAGEGYARLNPRRETPVLVTDDGHVLTQTMAIAGWLAHRDVDRHISFAPGSPENDRMHEAMAFINTGFTAAFTPLWINVEAPDQPEEVRAGNRRLGLSMIAESHRKLETLLGDTPFFVGERPTLADALLLGVGRWIEKLDGGDPADYPGSLALRRRIEATPAARFALAIENGQTPAGSRAFVGHVALDEVVARHG